MLENLVFIGQENTQKLWCLIHTWSDKALKGTVVDWALPSLHGGSLQFTRTIPLPLDLFRFQEPDWRMP